MNNNTIPEVNWRKGLRYWFEWLGVALCARIIPLLPLALLHLLANFVGWLAFHFDRKGRAVALANLALLEVGKSCQIRIEIAPSQGSRRSAEGVHDTVVSPPSGSPRVSAPPAADAAVPEGPRRIALLASSAGRQVT